MGELTALNGAPLKSERETKLVLNYDNHSGHLGVDGDLGNVDRLLNVLAQATRYFEAVYRFQQAQLMNAQAQQERQVAQSILARPH